MTKYSNNSIGPRLHNDDYLMSLSQSAGLVSDNDRMMMSANDANCSVIFSIDDGGRALRMLSARGSVTKGSTPRSATSSSLEAR